MNVNSIIEQLKNIELFCHKTMESDIGDKTKYRMIFSQYCSRKVIDLFKDLPVQFDYYDPDSSYTEDCNAFVSALTDHIAKLESNIDILTHFQSLSE